jgi:protein TonB
MQGKNTSMVIAVIIMATLHAAVLLLYTVHMTSAPEITINRETKPFALVDISAIEALAPPPAIAVANPPVPSIVRPVTVLAPTVSNVVAETIIETDTIPEQTGPPGDVTLQTTGETVGQGSFAGSTGSGSGGGTGTAALTAAYVRKNYTYIQRRISDRLQYPAAARKAGTQGTAEISFTIHDNGTISMLAVRVSSGDDILDQAALNAVTAAAPFPKPPAMARIAIPVSFRLK